MQSRNGNSPSLPFFRGIDRLKLGARKTSPLQVIDEEEQVNYRSTPVLVVPFGPTAKQTAAAFTSTLTAVEGEHRPYVLVPLSGSLLNCSEDACSEAVWSQIELAAIECAAHLSLNPGRRVGMMWDLVLIGRHDFKPREIAALLRGWACRSRWPSRVTLFIDASDICRPWSSPPSESQDEHLSEAMWSDVFGRLRLLESVEFDSWIRWNGAYLIGSVNRFGFVAAQENSALYRAHLATLCITSDLLGWLASLPNGDISDHWSSGSSSEERFSAIGFSHIWHPRSPWTEQATLVQAHRMAGQYGCLEKLGTDPGFDRWIRSTFDHAGHSARLKTRHIAGAACRLQPNQGNLLLACQRMLAMAKRRDDFLQPIREQLQQHAKAVVDELARRLDALGKDLVLGGGISAYADYLGCLEGQLQAFKRDSQMHKANTVDHLRLADRRLGDLMSPANRHRACLHKPPGGFFLSRWWTLWRRKRWLGRLTYALDRCLELDLAEQIDSVLADIACWAAERIRYHRDALERFRAALQKAATRLIDKARQSFQPPIPTALSGVDFEAAANWIEGLFPAPCRTPLESLADVLVGIEDAPVPPWHRWDDRLIEKSLRELAERQVNAFRERLEDPTCVPDLSRLDSRDHEYQATLFRLSHPLIPVTTWSYDSIPQCVFHRVMLPGNYKDQWHTASLPSRTIATTDEVPWPTVVTVYRDVPVTAVAGFERLRQKFSSPAGNEL